MYCRNCGNNLNPGVAFCPNCGTKIVNENSVAGGINVNPNIQNVSTANFNNMNQNQQGFNQSSMGNGYQQVQYPQQPAKPKKNKLLVIILAIIIVGFISIGAIFYLSSAKSEKLVCKSDEGNITIMYNKKGKITAYLANGITYDFDEQKEVAEEMGIDDYIKDFDNWFKSNTSGYCTVDGKRVSKETKKDSDENKTDDESANNKKDNDNNENKLDKDVKVVGDNKYGYITIPKNWSNFYDIDGNTSLQYSYANVFIVSLNYIENSQYTAKEIASSYMYEKQNSAEVTGVTGATVQIGKNKEYTAYQVYMYYPSDEIFLVTYWFEAEDGNIHYIALEGPGELSGVSITDYLYIVESFSLKNENSQL